VSGIEVVVALAIVVGIVGVVVPLLPGALLVLAAILVWAIDEGSATGWAVFGVATAVIATGQILKYTIPGRRLQARGVPNRSLLAGGLLGTVGFVVIPVVGVVVGFVLGIWLSEYQRLGPRQAWPSTKAALHAVGLSMLIELASALLATVAWITGVIVT
jgi:uncharacterized protein YqgC (DUF456 family)